MSRKYRRGLLFYFWDTKGIPLEMSLALARKKGMDEGLELIWLCQFVADALHAGWSKDKIASDLKEAHSISKLRLPDKLLVELGVIKERP